MKAEPMTEIFVSTLSCNTPKCTLLYCFTLSNVLSYSFTLNNDFPEDDSVLETPEISGRQQIADLKAIIINLGRQIFSTNRQYPNENLFACCKYAYL